jgi:hypothetical protein
VNNLLAEIADEYREDVAWEILISDQILRLGKWLLVAYITSQGY